MRKSKYTQELLEPIVVASLSWAAVLRTLGLQPTGGNYRYIQMRVHGHGISTTHFKQQSWARDLSMDTDARIRAQAAKTRIPDDQIFVRNSTYKPSHLYNRLIRIGWENKCAGCGLTEWRGKAIRLHVDHINGDHCDHRLENLRFLCPNCHSQTKTYTGRNIKAP